VVFTADDRDRALGLIARMFKEERARPTPHQFIERDELTPSQV
jgi:hypothetical protein